MTGEPLVSESPSGSMRGASSGRSATDLPLAAEGVVVEDDHGLAFGDGLAGGLELVGGDVAPIIGEVFRDAVDAGVTPLVEVYGLILQGVGELVGEDGFLLFGVDPVEEVYGLGFVVVEAGDLLGEQANEEGLEVEGAIEQAELLEDDLGALEALGGLVILHALR